MIGIFCFRSKFSETKVRARSLRLVLAAAAFFLANICARLYLAKAALFAAAARCLAS